MAQDERRRSLVVLNRVPPRSRLTEDIAADLPATVPIAATWIGNRGIRASDGAGLGVIEDAVSTRSRGDKRACRRMPRHAIRVNPRASHRQASWLEWDTKIPSRAKPKFESI